MERVPQHTRGRYGLKYTPWPRHDPIKNYFPMPNGIFLLGPSSGALAVYSYLLCRENRTTPIGAREKSRDKLAHRDGEERRGLVGKMRAGVDGRPEAEPLMVTLAARLEIVRGEKKYGRRPKAMKKTPMRSSIR